MEFRMNFFILHRDQKFTIFLQHDTKEEKTASDT